MNSELEAMKERARAWWRKHTANPKLPYAFKPREWTDETVALFASAEIEKAVAGLDIRCNLCGEILKAGPRDISTIHVKGCQCVIEKDVAQAVEARTREISEYLKSPYLRSPLTESLAENILRHYKLQPEAENGGEE